MMLDSDGGTIDAVVLAGGRQASGESRGLQVVGGRPLVVSVTEVLRESRSVGQVIVVGPSNLAGAVSEDVIHAEVSPEGTLIDSVEAGLRVCGSDLALVVSSDIPLLTPEGIEDFHDRCKHVDADVWYPIVRRQDVERDFPGSKRTYVYLREGVFTGGNLAMVRPAAVLRNLALLKGLLALRKSPWRLARRLGLLFLLRLVTGRLRIAGLERKLSMLSGAQARAVITPFAAIGVDVDKEEDVALIERRLLAGDGPPSLSR